MAEKTSGVQRARIILTWATVTVGILGLAAVVVSGAFVAYGRMYENRMFPGVRILGVRLDGLTQQESRKAVQDAVDTALGKGLQFTYRGNATTVDAASISSNPDNAPDLVHYNIDDAIAVAYGMGRGNGWLQDGEERLRMRVAPFFVPVQTVIDTADITDALTAAFAKDLQQPQDAGVKVDASSTPPTVSVQDGHKGLELVFDPAFVTLAAQAKILDFEPIELSDRTVDPTLAKADVVPLVQQVESYLQRPQLEFTYASDTFVVPTSTLAGWVSVTGTKGTLAVTLDPTSFDAGLHALASSIEKPGKTGSLVVKDGKVQSFVAGVDGTAIDTDATLQEVLSSWPASSTFPIIVTVTKGALIGQDPEQLGIKELIGIGTSNFGNSPPNRIKNIQHGVALVNGTLIQPGEIFSLVTTLGVIDQAHDWLPELVIKGNTTEPDFGGGLCQIGTTAFRAALNSGMPIIERQNHSYRVVYYEPAGTDATIFDPKPDFRFQNDMATPIYINAYIVGKNVYFEFWGTKDGRTVDEPTPKVYNITPPPPMKLVETLDLPPGQKKCTEIAHAGADADLDYTVTYADGTVKKTTFHSHYRPWQAVCLVGVTKLLQPADTSTDASSGADAAATSSAATSKTP